MLRQYISHDSRVADELYINRMLLALEDFLFFSLHSFTCIAKQFTTLKQLQLLSCLDFLDMNFECIVPCLRYHIRVTNITYVRTRPLY
jgi:hypothetical protein